MTDHYLNYTSVLVRLSLVTPDVLRELLGMAHKFVTAHEARRSPSRNKRKPRLIPAGFRAIRERQTLYCYDRH